MTELAHDIGIPTHVHSCGPEKELVKMAAEETDLTVIDPLEIPPMGDCDLAELKQRYGDRIVLKGNLHTTEVMLRGTVDDVVAASSRPSTTRARAAASSSPPATSAAATRRMRTSARWSRRPGRMGGIRRSDVPTVSRKLAPHEKLTHTLQTRISTTEKVNEQITSTSASSALPTGT